MPSSTYSRTLEAVGKFLPNEKAAGIIERQLPKCNATAENLDRKAMTEMLPWLMRAANLYIPDESNRKGLEDLLRALA